MSSTKATKTMQIMIATKRPAIAGRKYASAMPGCCGGCGVAVAAAGSTTNEFVAAEP